MKLCESIAIAESGHFHVYYVRPSYSLAGARPSKTEGIEADNSLIQSKWVDKATTGFRLQFVYQTNIRQGNVAATIKPGPVNAVEEEWVNYLRRNAYFSKEFNFKLVSDPEHRSREAGSRITQNGEWTRRLRYL